MIARDVDVEDQNKNSGKTFLSRDFGKMGGQGHAFDFSPPGEINTIVDIKMF